MVQHGQRLLVSGGAGYIGSHTARALAAAGHDVVILDRRVTPPRLLGPRIQAVRADVRDATALDAVLAAGRFDGVIHFAAEKSAEASTRDPGTYFEVNVGGTNHVLAAMVRGGVRRLVLSSSCAVYGRPRTVPVTERAPIRPTTPYGESKALAERLLPWFEAAHGVSHLSLRYFNAAGAALDGSNGEDWHGASNLMPVVIEAALGRRGPVEVFGRDYPTPDGTAIRDYVHVVDLAEAHVRAIEALADGAPSGPINLGTGRGTSVAELLAAVGRGVGHPVPTVDGPRRAGDVAAIWADPSLARDRLSWTARLDLEDIVASAVAWHRAAAPGPTG